MEYKMVQFLAVFFYKSCASYTAAKWQLVFLRYFFDGIQVANDFIWSSILIADLILPFNTTYSLIQKYNII